MITNSWPSDSVLKLPHDRLVLGHIGIVYRPVQSIKMFPDNTDFLNVLVFHANKALIHGDLGALCIVSTFQTIRLTVFETWTQIEYYQLFKYYHKRI